MARFDGDGVAELVDRSLGWFSGLRIFTGHRAVVLRRPNGGQGGTGLTGGEKSSGGRTHPGWSWVENSGRGAGGFEASGLEAFPGGTAE